MKIRPNDRVLILDPDERTYLLKVEPDGKFHTSKGILEFNDIIGKEVGDLVTSSLHQSFALLEPTVEDRMMKVKRLTQIIYPKDAAMIVLKAGISSGSTVIECGAGSGALSIPLANAVGPTGKLCIYEIRERFLRNAEKNITEAGLEDRVEIKSRDARDGFDQREADAAVLDLPSPWHGIRSAYQSLKGGGRLVSLSPTVNQVEETAVHMRNEGFVFTETFEIILRNYLVRPGRTRPIDRIVGHTGFITVGRKINRKNSS